MESLKIAIMQPYFFPYIGYFQLINAVDEFVVYDDIQYTKKGWINRNRILVNGKDDYISLPLRKDSDFLAVKQRHLADQWERERTRMLNKVREAYRKAPCFASVFPLVERCLFYEDRNLFNFIFHSLKQVLAFLAIRTPIRISSELSYDHTAKAEQKVIAICKTLEADLYINPIGASSIGLYKSEDFESNNVSLRYLKPREIRYTQFQNGFVPCLSILDVLMFNDKEAVRNMLDAYDLVASA